MSEGYRNSSQDQKPTWTPVIVPKPVFDNRQEMSRWEWAWQSTPRDAGEDPVKHLERVIAKAKAPVREPGEDDE